MSAHEARGFDGEVHLYLASDLADSTLRMLAPLHNDRGPHPDYHDRRHLSGPITRLARLDVCDSCKVAARWRAHRARKSTAVPPPRPSPGRSLPAQDSPTALAGANPRPAPARAPRRQP